MEKLDITYYERAGKPLKQFWEEDMVDARTEFLKQLDAVWLYRFIILPYTEYQAYLWNSIPKLSCKEVN